MSSRSAPPRLHVNSQTRSLSFDTDLVQSSMRLDAPDELLLEYTRAMMGFLLLDPAPASILMIGLGGGSLPKYCHKHLPDTHVTVVEIEQDVIDLRDEFGIPHDDDRLQVIHGDGARWVGQAEARYDVILVDGFHQLGQPAELCTPAFYRHCARALAAQGTLVINMHSLQPALSSMLQRVRKVFAGSVLSVPVDDGQNEVVFAAPPARMAACARHFEMRWAALAPVHQATLGACSSRIERALGKLPPCAAPESIKT
ncbi:MAG: hypothetical protein EOP40_10730 [Rubrivivax sp.]|nr:MAG: hypothetical protein EOP40_10730 [Rubrivivax sp.]